MGQIEGVLFDSGDTLVRPKACSWFPRQHFIDAFRSHGITVARMDSFDTALTEGLRYLDDHHDEATTGGCGDSPVSGGVPVSPRRDRHNVTF